MFTSRASYLDFWRDHPAVSEEWNGYVEDYLHYDLEAVEGGFRSRVSEEAVRGDGTETLTDPVLIETALASLRCPVTLVRATRNLINQPVALIPDSVVEATKRLLPQLTEETVPDSNHYTLMFGERGSKAIALHVMPTGMAGGHG